MDITITPHRLHGKIHVIPSKSQAHRVLICAAFADAPTVIRCPQTSRDMDATAQCLRALGTTVLKTEEGYFVKPTKSFPAQADLYPQDSGSTLRFMLPIVGALGVDATFYMTGRLPQRPLSPLWEELERMGCTLSRPTENAIRCSGQLHPGTYSIDGSVSSQFITGLLLALPLIHGKTGLEITGNVQSRPYIDMTKQALSLFTPKTPGEVTIEGDWSNGAFFLAMNAFGSRLEICGLDSLSCQGDKACAQWIPQLQNGHCTISAAHIPDLVPVLAVVAGASHGAVFTDIARLRLKESDRVASVIAMIKALGGQAFADENTLTVQATGFTGGTVDAAGDHRIAMSAAVAATVCTAPVTILGAEAVQKSYPQFWDEYRRLGGIL